MISGVFNVHKLYDKVSAPFREKRWNLFLDTFQPATSTTILDVGGYPWLWDAAAIRHIVLDGVTPYITAGFTLIAILIVIFQIDQ